MIWRQIDRYSQLVIRETTDGHKPTDHLVVLEGLGMDTVLIDTRTNTQLDDPEYHIIEHLSEQMAIREAQERLQHQFNLDTGYYLEAKPLYG